MALCVSLQPCQFKHVTAAHRVGLVGSPAGGTTTTNGGHALLLYLEKALVLLKDLRWYFRFDFEKSLNLKLELFLGDFGCVVFLEVFHVDVEIVKVDFGHRCV